MAYISQETKKQIATELKREFPRKAGWKFSLRVRHYRSLSVTILEAPMDLLEDVNKNDKNNNPWEYVEIRYSTPGKYTDIYRKMLDIIDGDFEGSDRKNYDNSDIMTDYFDVGWYSCLSIGDYERPFIDNSSFARKMELF